MEYNKQNVKWSQWSPEEGMIRCGRSDYRTIMGWMRNLGKDARECLTGSEKAHAVYGRVMHDDAGIITEIRLYCNTYLDDNELDTVAVVNARDTFYVAHK